MALKNAQNAAVIGSFPTPPLTASYDPENPLASLSFSAPALENHMPKIYTAWLFSLTDETALTQNELLLTK